MNDALKKNDETVFSVVSNWTPEATSSGIRTLSNCPRGARAVPARRRGEGRVRRNLRLQNNRSPLLTRTDPHIPNIRSLPFKLVRCLLGLN